MSSGSEDDKSQEDDERPQKTEIKKKEDDPNYDNRKLPKNRLKRALGWEKLPCKFRSYNDEGFNEIMGRLINIYRVETLNLLTLVSAYCLYEKSGNSFDIDFESDIAQNLIKELAAKLLKESREPDEKGAELSLRRYVEILQNNFPEK